MLGELINRRIHPSILLTAGSLAFLLGVILSLTFRSFASVDWLVVALCFIVISFVKPSVLKVATIMCGGVLLGLYRGGSEQSTRQQLAGYIGEVVVLEGVVSDDPTLSLDGDTKFVMDVHMVNQKPSSAEVWVSVPQIAEQLPDVKRSDTVEVRGVLDEGFGTFSTAMYRADLLEIIRTPYSDVARDVRDNFASHVSSVVDSPESDLGNGFLLGTKTRLPEKLDQELRILGLTHIVVASGYNLTILVRLSRRLFMKVSRFAALAGSIALVIAFAHVTGWSPSMTRAAMITLLSLAAWYYGRKFHPITLLSIVAAASVFLKPSYAWGDIGWLLSFLSFSGVIILAPMLHLYFWGSTTGKTVRQIVIETVSAQLMTAPLIIYVFGQYSSLALVANILILPFIPLAMLFTFVAGIGAYLNSGSLGSLIAWPAETLLRYMVSTVEWLAQFPFVKQEITIGINGLIVMYMAIVIFMIFLYKRTGYRLGEYNIVE